MTKRKHSVGYFSAYYRGLECLLDVWPKIKEQVPDATLDIYYGWQSWVGLEGKDEFYHRMCAKLEALKDQGVTEHGRVSHVELAKAMKKTQVWAYPTEFNEIHCITALKTQEAGCVPVTTNVAALAETVHDKRYMINCANIYGNEYAQGKFVKNVIKALDDHVPVLLVEGTDWTDVAKQWTGVIT